jgi:type I restriction enzyme S subunit
VHRLTAYPEYKDSGVEWLGEIPAHWDVGRLKTLLSVSRERNGVDPVGEMLSVSGYRGVEPKKYDAEERKRSDDELIDYRVVRVGQLVVNTMWLNHAGLGVSDLEGHVSPAYRCYHIAHRFERGYLHHLLRSAVYIGRYCGLLYGIRPNSLQIKNHDWDSLELIVPPREEQRAIAAFLDRETARIDALVAKQERLIELLQEKRTALITLAATKGLDPTAPMKDSGVEWLGEIPDDWEVAPVYARYEVALGKMLDASRVTGQCSGRYLRNVDVQWDRVNTEGLPEMDFAPWERERYGLRPGDLLVCEGGEVGRTAIWREQGKDFFYQKAIHRVRARSGNENPRHFYYLMYTLAKGGVFVAGGNPNTIDHLTAVQLRHYRLPFAPPEQQRVIAAFLDRETAKIDGLIEKVRKAIDRLNELRTALISAAVTGKIDVRNHGS